jgi:hypothetical protein
MLKDKTNREALFLLVIQIVLFSILCINFRAISQGSYHTAAVSDFIVATLQFFVIKKIATSNESIKHWAGYTIGSVIGSYLGIYISTFLP